MPLSPSSIHQKVKQAWEPFYNTREDDAEIGAFLEKVRIFDQLGPSNIAAIIFGYHDFNLYYINDAAGYFFGMSPAEIMQGGLSCMIACIDPAQNKLAMELSRQNAPIYQNTDRETLLNDCHNSYVNWKITNPRGQHHRVLVHIFPVLTDLAGRPLLALYLMYDMKPFVHPDTWWCRTQVGTYLKTCQGANGEIRFADILSTREMQVLRLLEKGQTSREIASELSLSIHTVDNHRRNMLMRTGAIDTSALLHICKLCRLLPPVNS